jgi:predicted ATPase/DNA-binding SARP family transcriptional activator/tetratricopeptide (TPR) repeat protein
MQVRLLGPIEIVSSTGERIPVPGTKMRGLVAILALDAGSVIAPQRLIDALWGDQPVQGANTVQVAVSKLRRLLADGGEPDRIVTRPSGYQLDVGRDAVDALRFEALLDQAPGADPAVVAPVLREALDLWRGAALADAPDTALTGALQARLDELRKVAVEDLVDAELALGQHRRLAPELESLVTAEPLRERRWGQLMRALYGSGQQADALRAFQRARETLVDQMGVEPGPDLRRLEAAVLAQDESLFRPAAVPAAPVAPVGDGFRRRGNVRHPVGRCLGREDDLDRLRGLVERQRLVTLVGPGGVGKTRLALELSVSIMADTPDGVWWVELTAAADDGDGLAALRRALQLEPGGDADREEAVALVARVLGDGAAVLVLDNCEHLLGSIDLLVEDLLGRCGQLRIVATSREGLGVRGELLFSVTPLALPAAVTLFEARLEGLDPDPDGDPEVIAQICERLDRLPLALELAAGRARHMRLSEILERLTDHFDVLRDGARTPQRNQRDLRAVADWSYELLEDQERIVFERLSVFADGSTLDAARDVCSGHGVAADDVEHLLDRLIDKSLIHADRSGAMTRFKMLQTLADYAGDRLVASGDRERVRRAHADWVRGLAASVRFGTRTTGEAVATVQDEDVAVRDAVAWSLAADPALALAICTDLSPFWFGTMRVTAGWELLSSALAAAGHDDPRLRASALVWAVVFATMVHDVDQAHRLAREATSFEQATGEPDRLARICFARALAAGYFPDDEADRWIDEARQNFTAAGLPGGLGHVSLAEGARRLVEGDLDRASTSLRHAVDVFRAEQDHLGLIVAVSRLGEAAWRRGDLDEFAEMHADLLELGRQGRSGGVVTGATARLALARLEQGALDEAQTLARDALASSSESFMPVVNGYAFKTAGLVNLRMGHVAEGRDQLKAAIEAFGRGTGNLGTGQAATCWVDLSRSYSGPDEIDDARKCAAAGLADATASEDPWVCDLARARLAEIPAG